jgi:hypothetical protein
VPQSHHLIEDAAQAPDVTLLVIGFFLTDLWGEIVWGTDCSLGAVIRVLEYTSNTEVSYLNLVSLSHENILSFQITVQDLAIMNVLYC